MHDAHKSYRPLDLQTDWLTDWSHSLNDIAYRLSLSLTLQSVYTHLTHPHVDTPDDTLCDIRWHLLTSDVTVWDTVSPRDIVSNGVSRWHLGTLCITWWYHVSRCHVHSPGVTLVTMSHAMIQSRSWLVESSQWLLFTPRVSLTT